MSGGKYSNCSHLDTTLPFCVDKPVRFIIRLLFGFASDSVFDKLNQSTNGETAMLSTFVGFFVSSDRCPLCG